MSAAAMSANESQGNVGYIIAGVVAAAAVVTAGWPSLVEYGTAAIEWISSTLHDLPENEAIALMIVAVAGFTLLLQSVTPLNLLAGPLFGVWKGALVFTAGATAGAVLCYIVGKTLVSEWARRQLESSPALRRIDAAVRTDGLKIIVLARLSPLAPFAILSYVLGATGASLGEYTLGTFIGLLPGVALYCWIGNNAADAASGGDGDESDATSKYLSLGFSVIASVVASTLAKRALDNATEGVAPKHAD